MKLCRNNLHDLDAPNALAPTNGKYRTCRACKRANQARYRVTEKGAETARRYNDRKTDTQ